MLARTSAFQSERGNCAVTAVHEVAPGDWSADDILEVAKSNGFPHTATGGWDYPGIEQGMKDLCIEFDRHEYGCIPLANGRMVWQRDPLTRPTLAQFMRRRPRGTHIVIVKGHALVVREGKIVDPNYGGARCARRRVWISYEIHNAGPGKYEPAHTK